MSSTLAWPGSTATTRTAHHRYTFPEGSSDALIVLDLNHTVPDGEVTDGALTVTEGGQVLEGWVITPRIVGDSVGLSTLAVIIAVMVFGELFGFYGVLVAVPAAAILKILVREGLDAYRASRFFREA